MTMKFGVLEFDIMDLKPSYREDERKYRITVDMLGKKAREAMATVEEAYYYATPGCFIGRVAVTMS